MPLLSARSWQAKAVPRIRRVCNRPTHNARPSHGAGRETAVKKVLAVLVAAAILFAFCSLSAAQAGSSPSLQDTMQFIQEKLSQLGTINYAAYNHDNSGQYSDWITQFSTTLTNVVADAAACKISFHEKRTKDGSVTSDADFGFILGEMQDVVVKPRAEVLKAKKHQRRPSHLGCEDRSPGLDAGARRNDNGEFLFYFFDVDLANRVARAMNHAVALCGGGKKEPF